MSSRPKKEKPISKEYIAEHVFYCANCGEQIAEGDGMYFTKDGEKVCASCNETIMDGEGNKKFDEDGFGEPE